MRIPYRKLASFLPDGNHLAYITKITEKHTFKRYRGGHSSDILLYDVNKNSVLNINYNEVNDGKSAWIGYSSKRRIGTAF
ncbi:MAG: hypothetical protein RLN90_03745 [Balneolaceae bacterium]